MSWFKPRLCGLSTYFFFSGFLKLPVCSPAVRYHHGTRPSAQTAISDYSYVVKCVWKSAILMLHCHHGHGVMSYLRSFTSYVKPSSLQGARRAVHYPTSYLIMTPRLSFMSRRNTITENWPSLLSSGWALANIKDEVFQLAANGSQWE